MSVFDISTIYISIGFFSLMFDIVFDGWVNTARETINEISHVTGIHHVPYWMALLILMAVEIVAWPAFLYEDIKGIFR